MYRYTFEMESSPAGHDVVKTWESSPGVVFPQKVMRLIGVKVQQFVVVVPAVSAPKSKKTAVGMKRSSRQILYGPARACLLITI